MKQDIVMLFDNFLKTKNLNITNQREEILRIFLKSKKHLSVDELFEIAKEKDPKIGHTTVFRTLKLLCEAGLAEEVDLGKRAVRYECKIGHEHHDHLICTKCGSFIEAMDPEIEKLQDRLCEKFSFLPQRHKMQIYGVCKKCRE